MSPVIFSGTGARFQMTAPDAALVLRATSSASANGTSICSTRTVSAVEEGCG